MDCLGFEGQHTVRPYDVAVCICSPALQVLGICGPIVALTLQRVA